MMVSDIFSPTEDKPSFLNFRTIYGGQEPSRNRFVVQARRQAT